MLLVTSSQHYLHIKQTIGKVFAVPFFHILQKTKEHRMLYFGNFVCKVARLTSSNCYYKSTVSIATLLEPHKSAVSSFSQEHSHLTVVLKHLQKLKNECGLFISKRGWESSMKSMEVCTSGKLKLIEISIL